MELTGIAALIQQARTERVQPESELDRLFVGWQAHAAHAGRGRMRWGGRVNALGVLYQPEDADCLTGC